MTAPDDLITILFFRAEDGNLDRVCLDPADLRDGEPLSTVAADYLYGDEHLAGALTFPRSFFRPRRPRALADLRMALSLVLEHTP